MMKLDRSLIDTADFNSAVGMGGIISRAYDRNLSIIDGLQLTDAEKETARQTLFMLSTDELESYRSTYACASAVGPARYNVKKGMKALDVRAEKGDAVRRFVNELLIADRKKTHKAQQDGLVVAFKDAVAAKQKTFVYDGKDYTVRGSTRFIESKYVAEAKT